MRHLTLFVILASASAFAGRPPVVLVDGYHLLCQSENLSSVHYFGELEARFHTQGIQVFFFGTCQYRGKPPIQELGNALGATIRNINAAQVDVISYSLGGLVVRSYLSGKQTAPGIFRPPPDTRVRKWVSIATPNFGALLPNILTNFLPDTQSSEMVPGNRFLFELATWNQDHDDLRGVDAVGIIGNAGGFGPFQGASDGTVAVTSASMSFALPDQRTRVLPYCHGAGDLDSVLGLGCDGPPLAKIGPDNSLSWSIIDSFLTDSDDWKNVGRPPTKDPILSQFGGVLRSSRDNLDQVSGPIQDQNFVSNPPLRGGYQVVIDKPGPRIAVVIPSAAVFQTRSLAPRMLISIFGQALAGSTVSVDGRNLPINFQDDHQINTLLPEDVSGLARLTVAAAGGRATANIFIEPSFPAVFTMDGTGTGPAAALRAGSNVSLFLTGLGRGPHTPSVTLNGIAVEVTYAGAAPIFSGLDQINFRLPPGVTSGTVIVTSGIRSSNIVTIP